MGSVRREVNPEVKKRLDNAVKAFQGKNLGVGWFASSKYADGTPVAYVASIHEFGYEPKNIPPRLGMRAVAQEKKAKWRDLAFSASKAILAGNETAETALDKLGFAIEGDFARHIATVQLPALKDSTVAARRSKMADGKTVGSLTKPLVETGLLLNSLTHVLGATE